MFTSFLVYIFVCFLIFFEDFKLYVEKFEYLVYNSNMLIIGRKEYDKMAENEMNKQHPTVTAAEGEELREIMKTVYGAPLEKGYNPINQLVGYILSEDPTYITSYNGARKLMRRVDRDELLASLLRTYLDD